VLKFSKSLEYEFDTDTDTSLGPRIAALPSAIVLLVEVALILADDTSSLFSFTVMLFSKKTRYIAACHEVITCMPVTVPSMIPAHTAAPRLTASSGSTVYRGGTPEGDRVRREGAL